MWCRWPKTEPDCGLWFDVTAHFKEGRIGQYGYSFLYANGFQIPSNNGTDFEQLMIEGSKTRYWAFRWICMGVAIKPQVSAYSKLPCLGR
jgi:hypothetical protein